MTTLHFLGLLLGLGAFFAGLGILCLGVAALLRENLRTHKYAHS